MEVNPEAFYIVGDNAPATIEGINIDHHFLYIYFTKRSAIKLYTFNSLMFPLKDKRHGKEEYKFTGPNLGLYYVGGDSADNVSVNHHINKLAFSIRYEGSDAFFQMKGEADLSKSYFADTYNQPTEGIWHFKTKFLHTFDTIIY